MTERTVFADNLLEFLNLNGSMNGLELLNSMIKFYEGDIEGDIEELKKELFNSLQDLINLKLVIKLKNKMYSITESGTERVRQNKYIEQLHEYNEY